MKQTILVRHPDDLTVAWAQKIVDQHDINAVVAKVDVVAVDIGTTTRVCVAVEHDGPDILPNRWFVKLPSLAWRARVITTLPRLLQTEVRFYNELAEAVPLSKPICLAAQSRFGRGSTLVLADVAEYDGIPSNASDTLTLAQATLVIEQLACTHARFWNNAHLDPKYSWLGGAGPVFGRRAGYGFGCTADETRFAESLRPYLFLFVHSLCSLCPASSRGNALSFRRAANAGSS